jgi:hypothetical protein
MRTGGTKEFGATTLLDMGGSPSLEKWFTARPKKKNTPTLALPSAFTWETGTGYHSNPYIALQDL